MTLGYDKGLFILAFDHRGSFQKTFFGVQGEPTAEETARIIDAKRLIFEGALKAFEQGVSGAGILVDEQFGSDVVRDAKTNGITVCIPVERSGQNEFDFEYGEDGFAAHITGMNPDFSKVLVRYNPDGDGAMNARQTLRLKTLGDWLHANGRKFLFELLVPAEPHQLETVGGDAARYDTEVRPALMRTAIAELQQAGVEPDVWKIEGLDQRADCEAISDQCRIGGRDGVVCVVLGRGADDAAVDLWLRTGSGVPGYVGFAIGRSIWWEPLKGFVAGSTARDAAAAAIAANYQRFVKVYSGA
jgi:myo-inositol catabolism protein IolC